KRNHSRIDRAIAIVIEMKATKTIKVSLSNRGRDVETPWAHDLGPAPGPKGSRKVRLVNVPFLHAKPTWGDVIVVTPAKGAFPTWDANGVDDVDSRIEEDGGRWAMIVSYAPTGDADDCFDALNEACANLDIVCEGATAPRGAKPGYVYFAVKYEFIDTVVMRHLEEAGLPCKLVQIHPPTAKPARPKAVAKKKKPAKKPVKSRR
ncbi:MAG: hypothetical protein ABI704_22390, partial [Kofleriaceae bacterium]